MYPAVLSLTGGDLLFTFAVRSAVAPKTPHVGLRAVLGSRINDGFRFDFDRDRIILETRSDPKVSSGGGFGPTVQLAAFLTSFTAQRAVSLAGFVLRAIRPRRSIRLRLRRIACAF